MKRFFIVAFCIFTMFIHLNSVSAHTEIEGLAECYEKIWIDHYSYGGVKEKMIDSYQNFLEKSWKIFLETPDYAKRKFGYVGTLEEQEEQFFYNRELEFDNTFVVWCFDGGAQEYLYQYCKGDFSDYLFYADNFWAVPYKNDDACTTFIENGQPNTSYDGVDSPPSQVLKKEELEYLKDYSSIVNTLLEASIVSVDDVKVVIIDWECTVLYVKSNGEEYMIRIHDYYEKNIPEFEKYKVYTASEAIKMVSESTGRYNKTKPTFEEEALSLQSEGLLNGTDKGLDLLKPLTRIETATMLLRAMGEETLQEENVQTFADVSNAHWGYGAAEKAYSLGLIKGVGDNLFAPNGRVTKEQFATMVLRAGNYGEFNWEEAFDILVAEGIISAEEAKTMDFFTRGDMAKIIYEAKNKGLIK